MNNINGSPDEERIARYLAGEASAPEIRDVEESAAESDENEAELNGWKKTWEKAKAPNPEGACFSRKEIRSGKRFQR